MNLRSRNPNGSSIGPSSERHTNSESFQDDQITDNQLDLLVSYSKYTSLVVENKGSVARDHLSNERTFLSWIRACLIMGTMSIGYLQFLRVEERGFKAYYVDKGSDVIFGPRYQVIHNLGALVTIITAIIALLMAIFGGIRYFHVQSLLMRDYFPASRFTLAISLLLSLVVLIITLVLVIKVSFYSGSSIS